MDAPSLNSKANPSPSATDLSEPFAAIGKLPIPLTVRLCHRRMKFRDFVALSPGDVISFEASCDSQLELAAGEMMLGSGTVVRQGTRLGLRLDCLDPNYAKPETK